jgi:hypothetical protein
MTTALMTIVDDLMDLVEWVAARLPQVPRLAILDAVEEEWLRLGVNGEPFLRPLVAPAAAWRLRTDPS